MEFNRLEDAYDIVSIGLGEENRQYPVVWNEEKWNALLNKQGQDSPNS
jgi:hypothetical protein